MHTTKRLLAASALVFATTLPVFAQDAPATNDGTAGQSTGQTTGGQMAPAESNGALGIYEIQPTDITVSTLIGQRVYATRTMPQGDMTDGAQKDWDDIGEVNEVILDRAGTVKAIIVGVGGFLGIGEKNVALTMQDVKFVNSAGDGSTDGPDYLLVVNADKQILTDLPAYEAGNRQSSQATDPAVPAPDLQSTANSTTPDATNPDASTEDMTADNRPRLDRPEINREGYASVEAGTVKANELEGATVYGPNEENVGEVNTLVVNDQGQVETVVLDIGGFLGMGEHRIGVTMDELNIVRNADGSDLRVYVNASEEALKAQPEWKDMTTTGSTKADPDNTP